MELLETDFVSVFKLEKPILELVLRGTLLYIGIILLLRLLPRRTGGELATMDLVFVVLIAEAATHSMGGYTSVTGAFVIIGTLMFWEFVTNWLSYRVPFIEKLFSAPPLQIIKDGKLLKRNMRREFITETELLESMRKEGLDELKQVRAAYVEGDGKISFLKK